MDSLVHRSLALLLLMTSVTAVDASGPFSLFQSPTCCDTATCDAPCDTCDHASNSCDGVCDGLGTSCSLAAQLEADNDCYQRPCDYWSLFGGWSQINSYSGEVAGPVVQRGDFNDGFAVGIARGRRFGNGLRGELELSYRRFGADLWTVNGTPFNWNGDLDAYFGMANLYHDWKNWQFAGLTPYIGGGIGIAIVDGNLNTAAISLAIDDTAFAYQGMAGFTKQISSSVDLFAEYRYVGTTATQLDRVDVNPQVPQGRYSTSIDNVMFGIRIWR